MKIYLLSAAFFAIAYFIGCFNLAYVLGKRRGMDIRKKGSGNPGASNAMTTMGWGAGVAVGAADIFKAAIPILLTRIVFSEDQIVWIAVAVGCIMGSEIFFIPSESLSYTVEAVQQAMSTRSAPISRSRPIPFSVSRRISSSLFVPNGAFFLSAR
jgi:hypothetical protein